MNEAEGAEPRRRPSLVKAIKGLGAQMMPRGTGPEHANSDNAAPDAQIVQSSQPAGTARRGGQLPMRRCPSPVNSASAALAADAGVVGNSWIYAASAVGLSHALEGVRREDAYAADAVNDTNCVIAVGDGLGSTANASVASTAAVLTFTASVCRASPAAGSWENTARTAVREVNQQLYAVQERSNTTTPGAGTVTASQRGKSTSPPKSTLTGFVLRHDGERSKLYWAAYGDSPLLLLSLSTNTWQWVSGQPTNPPTAATPALPGDERRLQFGSLPLQPDQVVVAASDGVGDAIAMAPKDFAKALAEAWHTQVSAAKFATLLDFEIGGLNDDRTIVMAKGITPGMFESQ
ncbi:protein phosphatase 2C domain-containing protein [Nocardia asteroides]|uniref:protein phosphatase 2C domain-containing protein n=1 Tax=Nocardia asteroides TaxID=1824 RepID=UPI00343C87F8